MKESVTDNPSPPVPKLLLEWLERIFPNCVPSLTDNDRQIGAAIGAQEVIRKLRFEYNKQNTPKESP